MSIFDPDEDGVNLKDLEKLVKSKGGRIIFTRNKLFTKAEHRQNDELEDVKQE